MAAVALTIDVGGLLYRRREMVNGADAAALAAAMECSKGNGLVAATAAANHQFEGDSPGSKASGYSLDSIAASPTCGGTAGHITVTYTTQQPLYFAPVLGMSDSHDRHHRGDRVVGTSRTVPDRGQSWAAGRVQDLLHQRHPRDRLLLPVRQQPDRER